MIRSRFYSMYIENSMYNDVYTYMINTFLLMIRGVSKKIKNVLPFGGLRRLHRERQE